MRAWIVLATVIVTASAVSAATDEAPFAHEVGLVLTERAETSLRVLPEWRRDGFPGERWDVVDAQGHVLPARLAADPLGVRPAKALALTKTADGHVIVFDLGEGLLRHDLLRVVMREARFAPSARLEASDDAATWRLIARTDLFRIGGSATLRSSDMRYPETTARYLRLTWPESAGFPELLEASVRHREEAEPRNDALALAAIERPCPFGAGCRSFLVELGLGATSARALALGIGAGGRTAVEILAASAHAVAEQEARTIDASATARTVVIDDVVCTTGLIEVRLWAEEGAPPALLDIALLFEPELLVIEAREATAATLRFGTKAPRIFPAPVAPIGKAKLVDRFALPAPPGSGTSVTRAVLPPHVLLAADQDAPWLVLLDGDAVIPVAFERGLRHVVVSGIGEPSLVWDDGTRWIERIEITMPEEAPLARFVELVIDDVSFDQAVSLERRRPGRPGVSEKTSLLKAESWRCRDDVAPCRLRLGIDDLLHDDVLVVRFGDGGLEAGARVRCVVWRPEAAMRFVWPEGVTELTLATVARDGGWAPRPTPDDYEQMVLANDAATAIVPAKPVARAPKPWTKYVLAGALALAALALIAVIRRAL